MANTSDPSGVGRAFLPDPLWPWSGLAIVEGGGGVCGRLSVGRLRVLFKKAFRCACKRDEVAAMAGVSIP